MTFVDVDMIMTLNPCSAWPRNRVAQHVPQRITVQDFVGIRSIPAPDRGWVVCQIADFDLTELAMSFIQHAKAVPWRDVQEAATNYTLAVWHADKLDGFRKADHFHGVMRDAAWMVAWSLAPSGGDEWDRIRYSEHDYQIAMIAEAIS